MFFNHPDIQAMNANAHYTELLREAETARQLHSLTTSTDTGRRGLLKQITVPLVMLLALSRRM